MPGKAVELLPEEEERVSAGWKGGLRGGGTRVERAGLTFRNDDLLSFVRHGLEGGTSRDQSLAVGPVQEILWSRLD